MANYDPFGGKERPRGRYFGGNRSTSVKVSKKGKGKKTPTVGRYFGKSPNQRADGSTPTKKSAPKKAGIPPVSGYLSEERARAQARDMRQSALERQQQGGPPEDDVPMPNFIDLLNNALALVKSRQSGVDYGAVRKDLSGRAAEGDSKIAAMYRQLQDAYKAEGPGIQKSFANAGQAMNQSVDQSTSNINASYDANNKQQNEQFSALGIADPGGEVDPEANRDRSLAISDLEKLRAINSGQNTQNAQTAGTFNTELGQAAGLGGSFRRGQLASQLQQKLAELSIQEQRDKADLNNNALAQAMGIAQGQQSDARYEREWATSQEDKQYNREADAKQSALKMILAQQQNDTAAQFDPQQVLDAISGFEEQRGVKLSTDDWIKALGQFRQLYGG